MKTAILSVGTEILFGQIVNTNTVYLSQQMNMLGFDVMYHYTVGDNPKRVEEMIDLAFQDCDLILTTGGLGPTQDDLTKEVACKALDDTLVMMDDVLEEITKYFKTLGREMTENNKKQAIMPSRATVFHNDAGTAPGFALEKDGKYYLHAGTSAGDEAYVSKERGSVSAKHDRRSIVLPPDQILRHW